MEVMTLTNAAQESDKYFDFDRNVDINAPEVTKALRRLYNFVMWFFVRDSWMALLPRWCGAILYLIAILRMFRVI